MIGCRSAAIVLLVLLLGTLVWAAQQPPAPAPGAPEGAAAPPPGAHGQGQLAILGRDGKPAGNCPLQHTAVTADIAGFVARVNVEQQFRNPSQEPVEAVYTFPLPEDAAVDDMTMLLGGRTIRGQIKKREEARAIYEAARAAGQSAALLDQERANIFTQSVANLMPRESVTIRISYVNLLKYEAGQYEWAFPMVVGPRYVAGGGQTAPGRRGEPGPPAGAGGPGSQAVVTDGDRITPPITPPETRAGHDISVNVRVDAGLPLGEVKSALHQVTVERAGPNRATVRLKGATTIPNRDFVLRYQVAGQQFQTGLLAHAPEGRGGYFTLVLQPPAAPPQKDVSRKEMVFVIDQTGSQSGWPIRKSKETMRYCIENLNEGDTFQVLAFNTQVFPCFPQPVAVTPENLAAAWKFLEPLEGNGGTDILKAADYALKIPDDPGRPRIVCYMTDGYVGNDMQILDFIRKNRGRARMFPFGIGNSVNRFLIDGMAREGRGAAEYVLLNEPGNAAAAKFYERVAKPLLLDVQVDWNGLPVADVYPRAIPDVFSAGPILLKGRYTRAAAGEITLHGLLRGQPWSQRIPVVLPANEPAGSALPTIWAREKIEDLQSQDYLGAQRGNPDPKIAEQIVNLALDYRLMSQYTSFVAVEERVVNVGGRQRRIDVPVEMPEGVSYDGIFGEGEVQLNQRFAQPQSAAAAGIVPGGGAGRGGGMLGGVGGFGGPAAGGRPLARASGRLRVPTAPARASESLSVLADREERAPGPEGLVDRDVATGTPEGKKRLAALKPEERRALLERVKLATPLHALAEKVRKEGRNGTLLKPGLPEVEKGRVTVQVWLNRLPPEALKQLQSLGFDLAAALTPGRLLLGTLPVERLADLLALDFVRRVDLPRFTEEG
jgi:Ca-activated chloride channel family protein